VIVAALLGGVQVVRNAAVAQYAETKPKTAARIWPTHPTSELWLGLTQIGQTARQRASVTPATFDLFRDAAKKAPLSPEPYLVRGVQVQLAGNYSLAQRAFLAAKSRDGRSIPARYFLAEQYFRTGDASRGLREIAILARMVPNGVTNLAPFVAAYAKNSRTQPQLKSLFRSDPNLEQTALATLAVDPHNTDLILALATPSATPPQWSGILLQTLVAAGQYADAYRVWTKVAHISPAEEGPIFNADFGVNNAPPPFNWTLSSSTLGLAEAQSGGRLHVVYYGQEDGVLATQLLLLKPGRHRLAMRLAGDVAHAAPLSWNLECVGSKAQLLSLLLSDPKRAAAGVSFEVPAKCAAQSLTLAVSAPEIPQQADVTVSGLRLIREQIGG
jgi:hypothetical protein